MDILTGQADVRGSMILDITPEFIVAAQSDPPILISMTDSFIEASIVHHDLVSHETTRWGWNTKILGMRNNYRLNPQDRNSAQAEVVFIGLPGRDELRRANIRQAYRIDLPTRAHLNLELRPQLAPVPLLNLSSVGVKLSTPAPSAYKLGETVKFTLAFPEEPPIDGEASVVRMEYEPGARLAKLGLKFHELNDSSGRRLHKIINEYMLAEQRRRNRDN